ncbi:MAG: SDR family NAD(P)-dependent oxidoreductase [Aeromicrobium sp.]
MQQQLDLTDRVVVVTGGNSGLGLGMVEGLLEAGATVHVWGTNPTKNQAAAEGLSRFADRLTFDVVDVGDEERVTEAMAAVADERGRLDACFNNAGIVNGFATPRFVDSSLEDWRRITRVNLDGTYLVMREAARHMIRFDNGGSLVGTSSLAANFGAPREESYAASKAGVVAIMQSLAVELGKYGIRANSLLPGWTMSAITETWTVESHANERILPRIPLRRWGRPDDWAGIAVYLASDASSFHTGDSFTLDGGYSRF